MIDEEQLARLAGVPARPLDDAAADRRDLEEADLPPLSWYDVLAALRDAPERPAAPGRAGRAGAALQQRPQPADRPDRERRAGRAARLCEATGAASSSSSPTRAREMLERMWPVYARGIAEDFLPALGSNPCEIRQTLEAIGAELRGRARRPRRRGRRGRRVSPGSASHEVDELLRVAQRRPVAEQDELRLERAEPLRRAAVLGRVGGEVRASAGAARGSTVSTSMLLRTSPSDEDAVGLAPEGDVAGGVAGDVEDLEAGRPRRPRAACGRPGGRGRCRCGRRTGP